jgi:hypothetical protein
MTVKKPSKTLVAFLALFLGLSTGCSKRSSQEPETPREQDIVDKLTTSLHGTTRGMEYWYGSAQGGFESLTQIPYDDLACKDCHVEPETCEFCHSGSAGAGALPSPSQEDEDCYGCHSRQYAEFTRGVTDYHRDELGYQCRTCHKASDAHGDGNIYNSMFEPGAIKASCSEGGCHQSLPSNTFHDYHGSSDPIAPDMECAACHAQSVVTCYNCHFEYEVEGMGKFSYEQITGWKLLLRRDRGDGNLKIDAGNLLAVTYAGNAFVALAPYHAHTIDRNAISSCEDCHNNEYVREYRDTGKINVVTWNETTGALEPNIKGKGIIPVPPDWRTSLEFDFVTYSEMPPAPPEWVRLIPGQVGKQMLFARPLEGLPQ